MFKHFLVFQDNERFIMLYLSLQKVIKCKDCSQAVALALSKL